MSVSQHPSQPPIINKETKPKRSVSFLNNKVVAEDDTPSSSRLARSSFQPGRRKGYVRKGPVNSDSEGADGDDDGGDDHDSNPSDQDEDEDQVCAEPKLQGFTVSQTLSAKAPMRPGHNYIRKAPINSDIESDVEPEERPSSPPAKQVDNSDSETDDKDLKVLTSPFSQTRISGPGRNYVRKAPVNSDTESDEEQLDGKLKNKAILESEPEFRITDTQAELQKGQNQGQEQRSMFPSFETTLNAEPTVASLNTGGHLAPVARSVSPAYTPKGLPQSAMYSPGIGMSMGNSSNSSVDNSSAAANIVNSMAIYQHQQQEMMMIMQQQQIQIATMHQQQQAYQLLMLQQQQQHQQQLQAVQLQRSRASSLNGSVHTANEDDDDDVPLSDKKQQLSQAPQVPILMGAQPGVPPPQQPQSMLGTVPTVHLSPNIQPSILSLPLAVSHPYSPLQYHQHSRQPSTSSIYSVNSVMNSPHPAAFQSHLQPVISSPLNPASFSPLVQQQQQQLPHGYQHHQYSHSYSHQQPRLADLIEEEQERIRQEQHQFEDQPSAAGGAQLLTSSFPAGYRHSIGSVSLTQLNIDRGSVNSFHSAGSNGSSNGGVGGKIHTTRHSLMPHQQQILIPSSSPLQQQALLFHQPQVQQPLIHVESKPPPPQTGLVGAISAMERERKLAKAHGTNQLQFQHQQQQQQMMVTADKERWLQEQRQQAWESEQMQQQQLFQQQFQPPQHQQLQQWTVEDEEDDNRPLSGAN
ncbi:hypothetical protein BGX27_003648 [Mortierella sp. AM989]|nr:hypothetical protein BGX27_003648 [Mortierella sp. AM989]